MSRTAHTITEYSVRTPVSGPTRG